MRKTALYAVPLASSLFVLGCVPKPQPITQIFNPEDVSWIYDSGPNKISGSALIRQKGGGVVTCAGYQVSAVPVSSYAKERIGKMYGNTQRGYNPATGGRKVVEPDLRYVDMSKNTVCDAQGKFVFDDLPNGQYYITTNVLWQVNDYFYEGGSLMQYVSVEGGESKDIVMTP